MEIVYAILLQCLVYSIEKAHYFEMTQYIVSGSYIKNKQLTLKDRAVMYLHVVEYISSHRVSNGFTSKQWLALSSTYQTLMVEGI